MGSRYLKNSIDLSEQIECQISAQNVKAQTTNIGIHWLIHSMNIYHHLL